MPRLQAAPGALSERGPGADGFESYEREVHALFVQAEHEVSAEGLERLDVDVPYVVIEGRKHSRVLRGPVQSKPFEPAWARSSDPYRAQVRLRDNVVALPRKRAA